MLSISSSGDMERALRLLVLLALMRSGLRLLSSPDAAPIGSSVDASSTGGTSRVELRWRRISDCSCSARCRRSHSFFQCSSACARRLPIHVSRPRAIRACERRAGRQEGRGPKQARGGTRGAWHLLVVDDTPGRAHRFVLQRVPSPRQRALPLRPTVGQPVVLDGLFECCTHDAGEA